jgi:hypothetical protein
VDISAYSNAPEVTPKNYPTNILGGSGGQQILLGSILVRAISIGATLKLVKENYGFSSIHCNFTHSFATLGKHSIAAFSP